MFTEKDLRELLAIQVQHPMLSVYLNTDPTEGSADTHKLRLRSMLKPVDLKEECQEVERYIDHEFDWSGRSVAIFSCVPEGFLKGYSFPIPIRSRVRIGNQPYVKPLADLLDAYGGYGVALVDKQGARLFHYHLGELMEQEGTMGETVRRTKRGGASSFPGRRGGVAGQTNYAEEVAEKNMREAAEFASRFFQEKNSRRILLGGTDDNVSLFRSFLPKAWQSLVVGVFPMSMIAGKDEVLSRAFQIGQEAERRREGHLVNTMITNAAKGRGGVIRLDETLSAVHDGKVQTLVIRDGYRAPGYRCTGCGYITAQNTGTCPFCGKSFENIPDAVELAVREVMKLGGEVEVLHNNSKDSEFGNIGALLRY